MIKIKNLVFNTNYYDVLQAFKTDINLRGINYLRHIKNGQDNIMVTCPFHKYGDEKNASAGISVKDGTFHCFTCGKVTSFENVLSYCLGFNDNGEKGLEWITNSVEGSNVEQRQLESSLSRDSINKQYVTETELDNYRYYHPYMFQRKLTKEIIEKFDVGYDSNFVIEKKDEKGNIVKYSVGECVTFPVRDKKGNCLFIARRAINQKLFHYPTNAEKPLYGIYELDKNCKSLLICESIFNCLTSYVYGKPAIALNGTGSNKQIQQIADLPVRVIYLALDNDEAGDNGCYRIFKALAGKFIFYRFKCPAGKDINDLTKEEFDSCYNNAVKIV